MKSIQQSFKVQYQYSVYFSENVFDLKNDLLKDIFNGSELNDDTKVLVIIDSGVVNHHPSIIADLQAYFTENQGLPKLVATPLIIPGGEVAKNNPEHLQQILKECNEVGLCRHSYIIGIGGGAILDLVGYAAAIAHRGIRHLRIPTTVLSQNDSGVGVKNGVNTFGKKNFLGTFAPPFAVINDFNFLTTLDDRDWRSGIAEAIKVALIKDRSFFKRINVLAEQLVARDMEAIKEVIYRCAELHLDHIAGGDPFELGSSRPLDFGHWSSHKLEQLTNYDLRHGEAVAIGIALDSAYSYHQDMLNEKELEEIIDLLKTLGFTLFVPELLEDFNIPYSDKNILHGLSEFREHLGGQLTVTLLDSIGKGKEVHEMDTTTIKKSIQWLEAKHAITASC